MSVYKEIRTQQIQKDDQVVFQQLSREFDIPIEILEKGIKAIIEWINENKPSIGAAIIGIAILAAISKRASSVRKVSISEKAELARHLSFFRRVLKFLFGMREKYIGNIAHNELSIKCMDACGRQKVPTSLIESMFRINGADFLFKYLDGTQITGTLLTDPILFKSDGFLFTSSTILKLKAKDIKFIEGTESFTEQLLSSPSNIEALTPK